MIRLNDEKGFTLVEAVIALALSVVLMSSMVLAFMGVKSMNKMARHHIQAMQVVRGQMDALKVTAFALIVDSSVPASFDAGKDGVFATADDLQGTLRVTVQDFQDMDADGNTNETSIDLDGDNVNDPASARPVRVSFTWGEYVLGQQKNFTVFADTLIAA